jgi:hypothetical protein
MADLCAGGKSIVFNPVARMSLATVHQLPQQKQQ